MKNEQREIVNRVFCDIIEQLAFMFGEPVDADELEAPAPKNILVRMEFKGASAGTLALAVPAHMCLELAANVLGLDSDDPDVMSKAIDALKELLNVSCGNLLTALAGEKPLFDLTVPTAAKLDGDGWNELLKAQDTMTFVVDDYSVLLQFVGVTQLQNEREDATESAIDSSSGGQEA